MATRSPGPHVPAPTPELISILSYSGHVLQVPGRGTVAERLTRVGGVRLRKTGPPNPYWVGDPPPPIVSRRPRCPCRPSGRRFAVPVDARPAVVFGKPAGGDRDGLHRRDGCRGCGSGL